MRNNRKKTTDRNSFSAVLKGYFLPGVLFFSAPHSLEHCPLSHQVVNQSSSAPASTAPSGLFSQLPEPAGGWGGAGQGSSGAAIPLASESHFPSVTGRSLSHLLPEYPPSPQTGPASMSSAVLV